MNWSFRNMICKVTNTECTPSLICGNCPHNTDKLKLKYRMLSYDKIEQDKVMNGKQTYKQKKKFEKLLQKLLDKGVIKSWYYNGSYHVTFNDTH